MTPERLAEIRAFLKNDGDPMHDDLLDALDAIVQERDQLRDRIFEIADEFTGPHPVDVPSIELLDGLEKEVGALYVRATNADLKQEREAATCLLCDNSPGLCSAHRFALCDMELLAKFDAGLGGARTGRLMRNGLIDVKVTAKGREWLDVWVTPPIDDGGS